MTIDNALRAFLAKGNQVGPPTSVTVPPVKRTFVAVRTRPSTSIWKYAPQRPQSGSLQERSTHKKIPCSAALGRSRSGSILKANADRLMVTSRLRKGLGGAPNNEIVGTGADTTKDSGGKKDGDPKSGQGGGGKVGPKATR